MPTIKFQVSEDFLSRIDTARPEYLDRKSFLLCLIDTGLTELRSGATLPAYRVGAGNTGNLPTKAQPVQEDQKPLPESSVSSTSSKNLSPPVDLLLLGDGVGKGESEGKTPRQPLSLFREIPDSLDPFAKLIEEFWRVKKGSKSDQAWKLLITELEKINASYGKERTEEQLELGINGLWKGITMRNFQRYETPTKAAAKEPEHRHPASKVFTAKDFDNQPTTNPALEGLF